MKTLEVVGKIHKFNTGRLYAANSQEISWGVIRCVETGERKVAFIDHARGIDGVIPMFFGNMDLLDDAWVLRAYDDFHYTHGMFECMALREEMKK